MKKLLVVLFVVLLSATFAAAQLNSNFQSPVDVLGAHHNHGRGCTGCHIPHSGPRGNGQPADAHIFGNNILWGEGIGSLSGATLTFAGPTSETLPVDDTATTPDMSGLLLCLSCHDGNLAVGAMMKNQVDWAAEGLNPTALGYASANVPTLLGADGAGGGNGNYLNDHPVGLNATISCGGSYNWDCTIASNGHIVPGPLMNQFIANYGFGVSPGYYNKTTPVVVCTTCHNQHVMTVYKGKIAGVQGYYQTQFGLRGYYNPSSGGNSVAQFCRQCHGGEANEFNNAPSVPTT